MYIIMEILLTTSKSFQSVSWWQFIPCPMEGFEKITTCTFPLSPISLRWDKISNFSNDSNDWYSNDFSLGHVPAKARAEDKGNIPSSVEQIHIIIFSLFPVNWFP